jgi:hypothetical protein
LEAGSGVTLVAVGTAAGVAGMMMNEALNQEEFCFSCILKAGLVGAAVGAVAAVPFLFAPATLGIAAFAGIGAGSGFLGYGTEVLLDGREWDWTEAGIAVGLGALTAGAGRYIAGRLPHRTPGTTSPPKPPAPAATTRPQSWFDNVARNATRNPGSNKLVLGHFARQGTSYQRVAAHYRATYFKVNDWNTVTKGLNQDEIWRINETFLTQQIRQGKQVLFSQNPAAARPGSFFEREVDFLRDLGYSFRQKNPWTWEAVR